MLTSPSVTPTIFSKGFFFSDRHFGQLQERENDTRVLMGETKWSTWIFMHGQTIFGGFFSSFRMSFFFNEQPQTIEMGWDINCSRWALAVKNGIGWAFFLLSVHER